MPERQTKDMPKHSRDSGKVIVCFDVETTGLPPSGRCKSQRELWPHIVQISWVKFCTDTYDLLSLEDIIVTPPIEIPESASAIHGITTQKARNEGVLIGEALAKFFLDLKDCDIIVAHNLDFDESMVRVEAERTDLENPLAQVPMKICTMKSNIKRCKIERRNKAGKVYYKYPRLIELHEHLFGKGEYKLHDALVDCMLCMRSYLYIEEGYDIFKDKRIKHVLSI